MLSMPEKEMVGQEGYNHAKLRAYFDRMGRIPVHRVGVQEVSMLLTQDINFPLYATRQCLTKFLVRYELFKLALPVHGHIIECGVLGGAGVMTWYHLSSIFEPYNHTRRIVGFDTFSGFPSVSEKDGIHAKGEMADDSYEHLLALSAEHDHNRPIGHIPRLDLVRGDAVETIPQYVNANPHLLVAMLYCDFDIYAPTRMALSMLVARMPKGAVIAFDEAGIKNWPGETIALLESFDMRHLELKRFPWQSTVSYAVL